MINKILLLFLIIFYFESFRYFNIHDAIKSNIINIKSFPKLFLNKEISDKDQEEQFKGYIKIFFYTSIKILVFLSFFIILIFLMNFLSEIFLQYILSYQGIFEAILIFSIYYFIRNKSW